MIVDQQQRIMLALWNEIQPGQSTIIRTRSSRWFELDQVVQLNRVPLVDIAVQMYRAARDSLAQATLSATGRAAGGG